MRSIQKWGLSLLFVLLAEGGGMEIIMYREKRKHLITVGFVLDIIVVGLFAGVTFWGVDGLNQIVEDEVGTIAISQLKASVEGNAGKEKSLGAVTGSISEFEETIETEVGETIGETIEETIEETYEEVVEDENVESAQIESVERSEEIVIESEAESLGESIVPAQTVLQEEMSEEDTSLPVEPFYLQLVAVGDNLIHQQMDEGILLSYGTYNFDPMYESVAGLIQGADIAIINQEVPCAGNELGISGYPTFNAPQEVLDAVARLGFNVITLATNHALDMGMTGIDGTLSYLHEHYPYILTTGTAGGREEANRIPTIEVQGVKIAVLNYTYGTNGYPVPYNFCINLLKDEAVIQKDIERAKEEADFVIVAPHWGEEYQQIPSDSQRAWAAFFAECGVDLVIGTHPHVVQSMEWITNSRGERTFVYYSLGNFVSAQIYTPRILGGVAKVVLEVTADDVRIADCSMDFVVTHFNFTPEDQKFRNFKLYCYRDYNQDLAMTHGARTWDGTFSMETLDSIVKSINPSWQ